MIATYFHDEMQAYCYWLSKGMSEYTIVCGEQDGSSSKIEFKRHQGNDNKRHCIVISEDYKEEWITSGVPTELRWTIRNSLRHFVVYLRSANTHFDTTKHAVHG